MRKDSMNVNSRSVYNFYLLSQPNCQDNNFFGFYTSKEINKTILPESGTIRFNN